jgi:hypothetical protein
VPLSAWFVPFAGLRLPPTGLVTLTVGTLPIRYIRTTTESRRVRIRGRLGATAGGMGARDTFAADLRPVMEVEISEAFRSVPQLSALAQCLSKLSAVSKEVVSEHNLRHSQRASPLPG